ncbi:MAG: hypothetical protein NZM37_09950 [Sandaracinaceae bacterium]|nr:hypothetical protein [Sandaracinaceae bacterium]
MFFVVLKNLNLFRTRRLLGAVALCHLGGGVNAGCEEVSQREAALFLAHYDALDINRPLEERKQALARLRSLPLTQASLIMTRDLCAEAYESEIRAEQEHARATVDFLAASEGGKKPILPEVAVRIEEAIRSSEAAIEKARKRFPECEREVRQLRMRIGSSRL